MSQIQSIANQEFPREEVFPKGALAAVLGTFNPNWYKGEMKGLTDVDKLRGDLALQTAKELLDAGHHCIIIDGGSPQELKDAFTDLGAEVQEEKQRGMSASRQQGFKYASEIPGVKMIAHLEPEKVSMAQHIVLAAMPILRGEADVVIPSRDEAGFKTYPPYQEDDEKRANGLFNQILRSADLLKLGDLDLDVWFGPRIFRNDPALVELFLRKFKFDGGTSKVHDVVRPDLWSNATFFPVIAALYEGYRVKGVEIPYRHPEKQTQMELDPAKLVQFKEKRKVQQRGIIVAASHFVRWLQNNPKKPSRLTLES